MGYARRRRPHTLVWVTVPPALVIQPLTLSRFAVNATSSRSGRNTSVTSYGRAFAICQTPFLGIAPGLAYSRTGSGKCSDRLALTLCRSCKGAAFFYASRDLTRGMQMLIQRVSNLSSPEGRLPVAPVLRRGPAVA